MKNLPMEFRDEYPDIPWRRIAESEGRPDPRVFWRGSGSDMEGCCERSSRTGAEGCNDSRGTRLVSVIKLR